MDNLLLFYLLLFAVALLYSSVGHGGASGYLALMAVFAFSPTVMKPTALVLNLFVSLASFVQFYRGDHFRWKIFLPLAFASVPMAFFGGLITLEADIYKKVLGIFLLFPVARFIFFGNIPDEKLKPASPALSLLIGASLGFLSGLIGIGGGIILSPVLLLLRWTNQKQTAAISALFIFVNSLSGLSGQLAKGMTISPDMMVYAGVALAGGLAGAYLGARRFNHNVLRSTLALVLFMAGIKLIFAL